MTDESLELSRRQLLAGLGTIGVGSATETEGAGVAACFSDGDPVGVPSGYTGVSTSDTPLFAVLDENSDDLRVDTVIEAFLQ